MDKMDKNKFLRQERKKHKQDNQNSINNAMNIVNQDADQESKYGQDEGSAQKDSPSTVPHSDSQDKTASDTKIASTMSDDSNASSSEQNNGVPLKNLKRYLTEDGINIFRQGSMEYLNNDMTIHEFPNLLDRLPALPDLEPVIKKYIAKEDKSPRSMYTHMISMLGKTGTNTRHDFSLMLPRYIRSGLNEIAAVANSSESRYYPSLVELKARYGDGKFTQSNILYVMLGGTFVPDKSLKDHLLQAILKDKDSASARTLDNLIRHHTITSEIYKWPGKNNSTTMNLPKDFRTVVSTAVLLSFQQNNLIKKSTFPDKIKHSLNNISISKSLSDDTIYQELHQLSSIRLLISTKLQHLLFDGLT